MLFLAVSCRHLGRPAAGVGRGRGHDGAEREDLAEEVASRGAGVAMDELAAAEEEERGDVDDLELAAAGKEEG